MWMAPLPAFAGSAHDLAVDRHHLGGHANQRSDPGDETALELLRVEGDEEVAKVIMRRRAIDPAARTVNFRPSFRPDRCSPHSFRCPRRNR
jgi:hypothetical protein